MKTIFFTIWESLQKVVALVVMKLSKCEKIGQYQNANVYYWKWPGGLSLSTSIFVPFESFDNEYWKINYIKHEYGHSIQSKILGPLYLFVIGIPSLCWAWLGEEYREKKGVSYYAFYTEKWANRLGGAKYNE